MSRPVTVLLVEDDQELLDGIAELLQILPSRYDFHVLKANHGKMALDLMAAHEPDLIVSDIMMPEMGGYDFLRHVRQNPAWIHIPFIFLTAKGEAQDIRQGKLSEANLYLTKPFETKELAELIQVQLDRHFERQRTRQHDLESLKKNMLQILNHEFRTPLTYVTAYYDMLKDNLTSQNYREYLRGIQAGCVRLSQLMSDLIQVIELRSGQAAVQFQERSTWLDLSELLQQVIEQKAASARQAGIEIQFTAPSSLPSFWGDAKALQAVFLRLLDNAIKFSPPHQQPPNNVQISAHVTADGREIHIAFQDEGWGIPEHMQSRVFDLFEQYNRELMEQQGTGLGLTIAKELTDLHQGRIALTSQENAGSTFTVILPLSTAAEAERDHERPARNGRRAACVLLVEDEENLLNGLADLLEIHNSKYNFNVLKAMNGKQGLLQMQEVVPDLIVSDIMMPEMDGYTFLRTVRDNPEWVTIPFIFLTAKGERQEQYTGLSMGVEEYVTKPYDSDDLLLFIEKQLDNHFQAQLTIQQDFETLKRNILKLIPKELMEPLTQVSVHTERLADTLNDVHTEAELTASLREIQHGGTQLHHLIEDLITLAEFVTGEAEVAFNWQAQPIADFGLQLGQACQVLSYQTYPDISFEYAMNEECPLLLGDVTQLIGSIERLVTFAVEQAQTRPDHLTLSLEEATPQLHLTLTSSSPLTKTAVIHCHDVLAADEISLGNMPEYVASLYIARGWINLHNGRLHLKNNPDTGPQFTITLPIHKPDS